MKKHNELPRKYLLTRKFKATLVKIIKGVSDGRRLENVKLQIFR
jgi:hypothetical protein